MFTHTLKILLLLLYIKDKCDQLVTPTNHWAIMPCGFSIQTYFTVASFLYTHNAVYFLMCVSVLPNACHLQCLVITNFHRKFHMQLFVPWVCKKPRCNVYSNSQLVNYNQKSFVQVSDHQTCQYQKVSIDTLQFLHTFNLFFRSGTQKGTRESHLSLPFRNCVALTMVSYSRTLESSGINIVCIRVCIFVAVLQCVSSHTVFVQ